MKKNIIKHISVIMALGMLCAAIPCGVSAEGEVAETVFTDVAADDWFYGDVEYVNEMGLMKGVAANTFAPEAPLSRAMCATILYRMAGEPEVDDAKISFADIPENAWYTDAVKWAYCEEIVNGKAHNIFAPNDNITRAELATMLFRYANYKFLGLPEIRKNTAFADAKDIPEYAEVPVSLLYCSEVINGKGANKFAPQDNTTRAEAAAMLHRFAENTVESDMWLLEKYGLDMSVIAYIDYMLPTSYPNNEGSKHLAVSFENAEHSKYFPEISVCVVIRIGDESFDVQLKAPEYTSSRMTHRALGEDIEKLGFQVGEYLFMKIIVAVNGEKGNFYLYEQIESVS